MEEGKSVRQVSVEKNLKLVLAEQRKTDKVTELRSFCQALSLSIHKIQHLGSFNCGIGKLILEA